MKANELMIGDWVMINPDLGEFYEFAGKPCQVIGLRDIDGAIKIDFDNGKYFWTDGEDDVLPVPLTPKILEKNDIDTVFKTRYKGFYLEYHTEVGMIMLYVYNNGSFQSTGIGFKYVHELQHALRLCEIGKTIEL